MLEIANALLVATLVTPINRASPLLRPCPSTVLPVNLLVGLGVRWSRSLGLSRSTPIVDPLDFTTALDANARFKVLVRRDGSGFPNESSSNRRRAFPANEGAVRVNSFPSIASHASQRVPRNLAQTLQPVKLKIWPLARFQFPCIMPDTMSAPFSNLSDAAREIGISRQTLYETYLPKYPPVYVGGHPVLTAVQIKAIRAEVRKRQNGRVKARVATT